MKELPTSHASSHVGNHHAHEQTSGLPQGPRPNNQMWGFFWKGARTIPIVWTRGEQLVQLLYLLACE